MDPIVASSLLGSGGSLIGNLINTSVMKKIEDRNFEFQKEQYEYSKNLQDRIFEREDTSIARRIADLKSQGLSPILAAGQGARAGAPIPVKAPQGETGSFALRAAAIRESADITRTLAEVSLIKAQADKAKTEADIIAETKDDVIALSKKKVEAMGYENDYAGQTLQSRVRQATAAAKSGEAQAYIDENKKYLSDVDKQNVELLMDYIARQPTFNFTDGKTRTEIAPSKTILEYIALQTNNDLKGIQKKSLSAIPPELRWLVSILGGLAK